jgi:hypothetical protein
MRVRTRRSDRAWRGPWLWLILVLAGCSASRVGAPVGGAPAASQGFVVATAPSSTRVGPSGPEADVLASARVEAEALERVLGAVPALTHWPAEVP